MWESREPRPRSLLGEKKINKNNKIPFHTSRDLASVEADRVMDAASLPLRRDPRSRGQMSQTLAPRLKGLFNRNVLCPPL